MVDFGDVELEPVLTVQGGLHVGGDELFVEPQSERQFSHGLSFPAGSDPWPDIAGESVPHVARAAERPLAATLSPWGVR